MSTKKLQIVTPIVTSVNGQTGDVTLDVSGSGGSMKKLTFTGGATGEYDGSSDVSVEIPEDRFYVLNITPHEDNTFTIANDFDEAIAATNAGKIITDGAGTIVTSTGYGTSNPSYCHLYATVGNIFRDVRWEKATGIGTIVGEYIMPGFDAFGADSPLTSSGTVYWDKDKGEWTIKDISSNNSDIYILNMVSETVDGTEVTKITNDFDEAKAAYDAGKIIKIKDTTGQTAEMLTSFDLRFTSDEAYIYLSGGGCANSVGSLGLSIHKWDKTTGQITYGASSNYNYVESVLPIVSAEALATLPKNYFAPIGLAGDEGGEAQLGYVILPLDTTKTNTVDGKIYFTEDIASAYAFSLSGYNIAFDYNLNENVCLLYNLRWNIKQQKGNDITFLITANFLLDPNGDEYQYTYDMSDTEHKMVFIGKKSSVSYKAGNGILISDDGTISVTAVKMYSGTSTPDDSLGENGDIYVQTEG